MKIKILVILLAVLAILVTAAAIVMVPAIVTPSGVTVVVPDIAVERAFGLEPGSLERTIFIHYVRPEGLGAKAPTCYKLLGVKWKSLPVSYVIHPDLEAIVPGAIFASAETWDTATSKEIFNDVYSTDPNATWDDSSPDGRNELVFGNYPESGVIAVTVVWSGIPIGSKGRQIIEFDILFDTDFTWGDATVNSTGMDLQNIATHEIGHGVGLADIYSTTCSEVTMYGYSTEGETQKRTLEQADITGLRKMYGS